MSPTVSIVMPCFNAAACLRRSIGSVQTQTMANWELIVVDDGSSDESVAIVEALARDDSRIQLVRQANAGAAAARNRGLWTAKGSFTGFLDGDDTWEPSFLERMVAALDAHPDAGIAYCGWKNIGLSAARDKPYIPPDYEAGDKLIELLRCCPWPIHGALVRAELIRDAGGFDESFTSCMDYDLWLRLGTLHRLVLVPQVLAFYHHDGEAQITSNKARISLNHLRVQQKFLTAHPEVTALLDRRLVRALTYGELLRHGYEAYWQRDLPTARIIFRAVMRYGYGSLKDWMHMLPAWLPEGPHRRLLAIRDGKRVHFDSSL